MSAPEAATPRVTLYGRPECHLCDEARDALLAMRAEGIRFELAEVDIESDDALLRAHLERIPVVEVDGEEASTLAFDAAAVRSAVADMALAAQRRANTERVKDAGSEAC